VGQPLDLPEDAAGEEADSDGGPPRAVTTTPTLAAQSVWVVRVGAFADDARATSLVGQLAVRGFTAFKGAATLRSGTPLHLVLVGPYVHRQAAAAALDTLEEIPGMGQPILQLVPPAVR
jgi:cell division septation protein DedD